MSESSPDSPQRGLVGDVVDTLLTRLGLFAFGLGMATVQGRGLGSEGFGIVALAIALPTFLASLLNLGVGISNVFFIGRNEVSLRQAAKTTIIIWALLSLLGVAAGAFLVRWQGPILFPGLKRGVLWAALATYPILLLQLLVLFMLQAVEDFRWYNWMRLLQLAASLLLTALVILVLGWGATAAVIAYSVGLLLSVILGFWRLWLHLGRQTDRSDRRGYAAACLRYGWKANLISFFAFLNQRADVFLISLFWSMAAAGAYMAATVIIERLLVISEAVTTVIFPRLSRLHGDGDKGERLTPMASRLVFTTTLMIAAVVAPFASPLLTLLFGAEYSHAAVVFLWLLPGTILASMGYVIGKDIVARGRVDLVVWSAAVLAAANVSVNLLLIPRFGLVGAGLGSSIGWTIYVLMLLRFYTNLSGIRCRDLFLVNRTDRQVFVRTVGAVRGELARVAALFRVFQSERRARPLPAQPHVDP